MTEHQLQIIAEAMKSNLEWQGDLYVEKKSGRIVGEVASSIGYPRRYYAFRDGRPLGEYVSHEAASRAVEALK